MKRYAAALLGAGLLLAVLTPAYIIHAVPSSAIYHRSVWIFVMQVVPYAVGAALWLPSRNPSAPRIALGLSILLLIAACVLYVPRLVHPEAGGGDMVGLGYILVCLVTTAMVLAISLVAVIVTWWSARARRRDTTA